MLKILMIFLGFFASTYAFEKDDQLDFFSELLQHKQRNQQQDNETYLISLETYQKKNLYSKELIRNEKIIWEINPVSKKYRIQDRIISDIENQILYWQHYEYDEEGLCQNIIKHEGEYPHNGSSQIEYYFDGAIHSLRTEDDEDIIDPSTNQAFSVKNLYHYHEDKISSPPPSLIGGSGNVILMKYAALRPINDTLSPQPPNLDDEMHILPYPPTSRDETKPSKPSSSKEEIVENATEACKQILKKSAELRDSLSYSNYIKHEWDDAMHHFFGLHFLKLSGYYQHGAESGSYGPNDEIDKVRITLINGILNIRNDLHMNLLQLSSTHGGAKIHFVFRPTKGWTLDLIDCSKVKAGIISPQAHLLAEKWKELIQEMGGTEGGGKIIHYAHSIGGSDTFAAKKLMTPQELKMIHVTTIGSPTMIPNEGFASVINYASKRDGVCLFDPANYLGKLIKPDTKSNTEVVFLGSFKGIPFIEHTLAAQSYDDILHVLGKQFQEKYTPIKAIENNKQKSPE